MISVFGLGKVGLPLAALFASKGKQVIGVDVLPEVVESVNRRQPLISEPGLELLLDAAGERLVATMDGYQAARATDVSIVIVPTPSMEDGAFTSAYVAAACEEISRATASKDAYHLVVVCSTVMPGTCAVLAQRQCGLCYNPAFIALGNVIEGFTRPDVVLIGESDPRAGDALVSLLEGFHKNDPPFRRMSLVSAEITKLSLNVAVVTKMAVSAQITWMCQRYPGADADEVLRAIGDDYRIGHAYFAPALWPGGPCFPRDNRAFVRAALRSGHSPPVAEAVTDYLSVQVREMAALVDTCVPSLGVPVGVLGLTYKADYALTEESYGLALVKQLMRLGHQVEMCDPYVLDSASLEEIVERCTILVVTVEHAEFKALEEMDLRSKTVIDCRGFLDEDRLSGKYVRQGRG